MAKELLPKILGVPKEKLVVVSVMPCTAKKFEAEQPKFQKDGVKDVDYVLTTLEIARMMSSMGIQFNELEAQAFDMPFGFATGAGIIFGATGGVMEAALRYAYEKISGETLKNVDFKAVRGFDGLKEASVKIGDITLKAAVVHGLENAKHLAEKVASGKADYHLIEVMSCPGGCISGAGQPITSNTVRKLRAQGLYNAEKNMPLQKSQDNYILEKYYAEHLGGGPGSKAAHHLLHTKYVNRSQIFDAKIAVSRGKNKRKVPITVTICANIPDCPGQRLLATIVNYVKENKLIDKVDIDAAFSSRQKRDGTISVTVGSEVIDSCKFLNAKTTEQEIQNCKTFDKVKKAIDAHLGVGK